MSARLSQCRLCSSARYAVVAQEIQDRQLYTLVRCLNCSLVYTRETYAAVSPEYTGLSDTDLSTEHIWLQTLHKQPAFAQCLRLVRHFRNTADVSSAPNLLDVGCGVGGWLRFAASEYTVYGFDASLAQVRYARQFLPNVGCATSLASYRMQLN